jgi:hypothetical protein
VDRRKNNRRKLWDVPAEYHCPIIGTCLHVEELRQIARKAGNSLDPRSSDYQLHVRFVAAADGELRLYDADGRAMAILGVRPTPQRTEPPVWRTVINALMT